MKSEGQSGSSETQLLFGLPPSFLDEGHRNAPQFIGEYLSDRLGVTVTTVRALTYDDLSTRVTSGQIHAAWLPPVVFAELERAVGMRALVAAERGGGVGYYTAFFALTSSELRRLEDLPGCSVGWVGPNSAAGYVFPRLQLAAAGIDPTQAFQEELFLRTHENVVHAVLDHAVDVGATYVHLDPRNPRIVLRSGWDFVSHENRGSPIISLPPFGPLPSDVIAVTGDLPEDLVDKLEKALLDIHTVPLIQAAAQDQFGTGRFVPCVSSAYDVVRKAMASAEQNGLEISTSVRPIALV